MKSLIQNVVVAAFAGGIVSAVMQTESLPLPQNKMAIDLTSPPVVLLEENNREDQSFAFIGELKHIKTELQKLNNQQNNILQEQESLIENYISLKDDFEATNLMAPSRHQAISDVPKEENKEEFQLSRIFSLDNKMRAEDSDSAWEGEAQSVITNGFEGISLEGSSLQAVECQGKTCRIEVSHNSEIEANNYIEDTFNIIPWDHSARIELIENDNNRITSLYYATKE